MTFLWPWMLAFLLTVPALVAVYLHLLRRKRKTAVRFASLVVVKEAMGKGPGFRRHIPPLLLLLAWTVGILALARPAAKVTLPSHQNTVVLAMDVSGSMRAADVAPDRITASQVSATEFVQAQPAQTRVGVVAFAGTAMLVQSPTADRDAVIGAIERFQLQRGTNIGGAILTSLQTLFPEANFDLGPRFRNVSRWGQPIGEPPPAEPEEGFTPVEPGSHPTAAIVLLTDGQATTGPDPIQVARLAADRGVRVFTVGFGSRDGEIVGFGGRSMRVQLDEETLRQVSEITRGRYFHAASGEDLSEVYRELSAQFVLEEVEMEITAGFAGFAALLMLAGALLSMVWFNRVL
jgi:Ca-activated chloride channel homolog